MKASETQINIKPRSLLSPLLEHSSPGNYSTSLQTPSPQPRQEFLPICKCGSPNFVHFKGKLNCKGCGVFAIKQSEGLFVFVSVTLNMAASINIFEVKRA